MISQKEENRFRGTLWNLHLKHLKKIVIELT